MAMVAVRAGYSGRYADHGEEEFYRHESIGGASIA